MTPLNTAVLACLTTCFYALARLGEFMVQTLKSFSLNTHVTTQNLSYDQDCNRFKVTVFHLPTTKVSGQEARGWRCILGDTGWWHWPICSPAEPSPHQPTVWSVTPVHLLHQAHCPSPNQDEILGECRGSCTHSWPQAIARSWHLHWLYPQVPPLRGALQCDEGKGMLGQQLLPAVPMKTCCGHHPIHPGHSHLSQRFHLLYHAPSVLGPPVTAMAMAMQPLLLLPGK